MPARRIVLIVAFSCWLWLAAPARAADPVLVRHGDRVSGAIHAPDEEIAFAVDLVVGTRLTVTVKADGSALRPLLRLYDPDRVATDTGTSWYVVAGPKVQRRRTVAMTGRYTILLQAANGTTGAYRLKVKVRHPRKVREEGALPHADAEDLVRIPALPGTSVKIKVRGRDGLRPRLDRLLDPTVRGVPLGETTGEDRTVRAGPIVLADHGDHRLAIRAADGTTGGWKATVKLAYPPHDRRTLAAHGWPAWTFRSTLYESRDQIRLEPPPPPPPFRWTRLTGGRECEVTETETVVIRTPAEYQTFLSRVTLETFPWTPDLSTDFGREMLVAIFLGTRPNQGYAPQCLDISKNALGVRVDWYEVTPSPCSAWPPQTTRPWALYRFTRVDGEVRFERGPTRPDGCRLPAGDD